MAQASLRISAVCQSLRCSHIWRWEKKKGRTKNQTSNPTVWLRMRVCRMNLRRTKSTIISRDGSFLLNQQTIRYSWPIIKIKEGRQHNWAPSSEFVSSSIPSWQILTAHAQPFRGARDLAFCLKVPLHSLLVWASSEGSGETARMRRLAWTFAARIGDKYQIRLTRSINASCVMALFYFLFFFPWNSNFLWAA